MSMGGSSQPTETRSTTVQEMSPEQRQLYSLVIPAAKDFMSKPLELFPGSTIAGFDPLQLAGQQMSINAAMSMIPGRINKANAASDFLLGPALFPESNPALQAATNAAIRPVVQTFEQSVLPQIRGGAVTAGGYGGSRQGIAEGIAGQELVKKSGDISATMASDAYARGLDAMTKTLGMQGGLAQLNLLPGTAVEAVGSSRRALEQAYITEQASRFMQEQMGPFLQAQQVAALAQGIPGGSATTTGMAQPANTPETNPLQYLMAALAVAGMFASDQRFKRDIRYLETRDGVPLYSFRYAWGRTQYVGTLAQKIKRTHPEAVVNVLGILFVDYSKLPVGMCLLSDYMPHIA